MQASTTSQYHGLLKEGYSKIETARVTDTRDTDLKDEKIKPYNEWTKEELYQEAIKAGVPGRSYMNKKSLIKSLLKN